MTSPSFSPAAAAGLKEGDVIVQINENKVASIYDLTDVLSRGKPGEKLKIAVLRDGKRVESEATLVERRSNPDASAAHGNEAHGDNPHGGEPADKGATDKGAKKD